MLVMCLLFRELISFHCRTEMVLDKSGISIAPPKRTRAPQVNSGPSMPIRSSTRLWVKEKSDVESSESGENIEENSEDGEESGESGEESEGGKVEVEGIEVESPSAHVGSGPAGLVSSGLVSSGPVGPTGFVSSDGSGPVSPIGPASITEHPKDGGAAPLVPVISILPATPVKIKGKGKAPDDNQEDMLQDNPPDLNPASLMVGNDGSGRLKHGRERSGTGEIRVSKTHRRSASHSTATTVPSTEDDDMEDIDEIDPEGSSCSTGGFSRGRAAGNNFNWGDADDIMDPPDWNPPTQGKDLVFDNRDPGTAPYMSFSTETTSELPVVLKELSRRFSPIERKNSRIYVFEDETWEVKGRFSQAVKDKTPLQWEMTGDGKLILPLLVVGAVFFILSTFIT